MTMPQHITPVNEYYSKVIQGRVPGVRAAVKFGRSTQVNQTESVIWDHGGNYTFLDEAEFISCVSDDAEDNPLGLGAHTMVMFGLDANYDEITEVMPLNGLTPVITAKKFLRLNRMLILTSGTNDPLVDANIGTITSTTVVTAVVQAKILPHDGQTQMMLYTVPRGHAARAVHVQLTAGQGKSLTVRVKARNGPTTNYAYSVKFTAELYQNVAFYNFNVATLFPEMTDVVFTGQSTLPGPMEVSLSMGYHLYDNSVLASTKE